MSEGQAPIRRAIGLMSGTSMDGIDMALIETDGREVVRFGPTGFSPYADQDRAVLRAAVAAAVPLQDRTARPAALAAAETIVTDRHAEAIRAFLRDEAIDPATIDIVGFHGQTVLHRPHQALTIQIGRGDRLAQAVGLNVVADLRAADMAAGGEGAPFVPVYHQALVRASGLLGPVLMVNIGGVSNVTFVDPSGGDPIACDTGPGNALLDDLMLEHTGAAVDRDGATAAQGTVDAAALAELLQHPFFALPAPKSLDRNAFSRAGLAHLGTADAAATLTAFTAASLASILAHLPAAPRAVVICGGGARNPTLMGALRQRFPCPVTVADDHGWSGDAIEAQAFAYLAVRSLDGLPLSFPTTTGVRQPTSGGVRFSAAA